ncbi:MAG: adenylate/guanylate cyclase domain-containing protein, partial [Chloroflexota bacterium]
MAAPTGTVTFLFTDIEGSTSSWEQQPALMPRAFARQEAQLRSAIAAHGGYAYKMVGDAFQAAISTAAAAVAAAVAAQRGLAGEDWGARGPVRVRMALHSGVTEERGDDYVGPLLNRAARLLAAGHGGQILLSAATHELVRDALPAGVGVRDLGEHRLKDLIRPERIFQVVAADLPSDFPLLRTLENRAHNLPLQPTSFIRREREQSEVTALLGTSRLVTLTGSGGVGKTRLALAVAADLVAQYPDGVWLVELAPLTESTLVPTEVAQVLGVREEPGRPLIATLTDHLRDKRLLLVLDNCEHLVTACAGLASTLLRACTHLRILATSREGLEIAGEQRWRVPSLPVPDLAHLPPPERLAESAAVALFMARARERRADFALTAQNARAVAQICAQLDCIPLAVELAAARVPALGVEGLAARLD